MKGCVCAHGTREPCAAIRKPVKIQSTVSWCKGGLAFHVHVYKHNESNDSQSSGICRWRRLGVIRDCSYGVVIVLEIMLLLYCFFLEERGRTVSKRSAHHSFKRTIDSYVVWDTVDAHVNNINKAQMNLIKSFIEVIFRIRSPPTY